MTVMDIRLMVKVNKAEIMKFVVLIRDYLYPDTGHKVWNTVITSVSDSWREEIGGYFGTWVERFGVGVSEVHIGTGHSEIYPWMEEHHVTVESSIQTSACFKLIFSM